MRTALRPRVIDGLLPAPAFRRVREHMEELRAGFAGRPYMDASDPLEDRFNRNFVYDHPVHRAVHDWLVPVASQELGVRVKKSYAFASLYGEGGICPAHTDRPQCQYTIDLCVSQRWPWGLFVDGVEYLLEEGQALLFSGTASTHWRDRIQPGNHCDLVFFHFVDADFDGPLG